MTSPSKGKTIAKNTTLLYIRMIFTLLISLYTSRVILNVLGVVDYGIYNVVAGVVTMLSFFSGAMVSSTQRFLSFELGRKDYTALTNTYSVCINIHVFIAAIIFIIAEILGVWFINNQLTIPADRLLAANWTYQFALLTFLISIITVPLLSLIIAHERMGIFAKVSILDSLLKLGIVFLLNYIHYDKLILYSFLYFIIAIIPTIIYIIFNHKNFEFCKYRFFWEKEKTIEILKYAAWNLWGNLAAVSYNQGINIMLNIFFGPVVNTARGISYQVSSAVTGFVSNFQMAMNPQIVKSYAEKDISYMEMLVFRGAKFSFFLLLFLTLPILIYTYPILKLWLNIVPDYTVIFCRLILIISLIDCISGTLMISVQASGNIKLYQAVVGGLLLLILPISWIFLKLGYSPQVTLYVNIVISIIAFVTRLFFISSLVSISPKTYLQKVILPIIKVLLLLLPVMFYIKNEFTFIIGTMLILTSTTLIISIIGLDKSEKGYLCNNIRRIYKK